MRPEQRPAGRLIKAPAAYAGIARRLDPAHPGRLRLTRLALTQRPGCAACHGVENRIVGPAVRDVARRHADRGDAVDDLAHRVSAGGAGVWGAIPMPPQSLSTEDARAIAQSLATGAVR